MESVMRFWIISTTCRPGQGDDGARGEGGGIHRESALWRPASADKAVSLMYERVLRRDGSSNLWVERCKTQITGVLEMPERERAAVQTPYWYGERIGHADIAVACALRFAGEGHPALFDARYPALTGAFRALRSAAAVQEIVQPLEPPKVSSFPAL